MYNCSGESFIICQVVLVSVSSEFIWRGGSPGVRYLNSDVGFGSV